MLQQHLPFTVLKLNVFNHRSRCHRCVATAPTVYGIETWYQVSPWSYRIAVATAPTVYGIETNKSLIANLTSLVATAPTVYGIETPTMSVDDMGGYKGCNSTYRLRY